MTATLGGTATPTTMCEAFQATVVRQPSTVALRTAGGGTVLTWARYAAEVRRIAAGLAALGVRRGDPIALLLTNRPEFHLVDTAAQHLGAVPFSCYHNAAPAQIAHLLNDSGARLAVTERRLSALLTDGPARPSRLIVVDGPAGSLTLDDVAGRGAPGFDLEAAARAVAPGDLLTLVYTSGTTGAPKAVEITHAAMAAMATSSAAALGMRAGDRLISFLPSAHIADRWANHYLHSWVGTEVTTLADPRDILDALRDVRPTLFGAVPQIWQRLAAGVRHMLGADPHLQHAVDVALQYAAARRSGEVPADLAAAYRVADQRALSGLRAHLGLDRVRLAVTAAAPAPPAMVEFVNALGVPLSEAWGMSELSGMATMNPPGDIRPGTVGRPLPGVEIRLAPDGELLVRGAMVMRGYRGRPEDTRAAVDPDGWLHTGDVAIVDADGYVSIVDRKKEIVITSGGENVAPARVELAIKTHCPLVAHAVVAGDARPYLVALLVLDPEAVEASALPDPQALRKVIDAGIDAANGTLSRAEQVRAFTVLTDGAWTPGGDMVTATMKVRRRPVLQAYAERIEALYAQAQRP
ncbi:AMP-dependent synthetase/ligase [Actinoplanes sp. NPDC049681]|uniref:AMP-dependent synthetase/ligase n=1 Tax=Actinoplanes sp. NPDC049681 TaxID=3363905 RepID=UPI0037AE4A51